MNINGVDIDPDKVIRWTDKLTVKKFLLVLLFVASGIMLWAMWEQRSAALSAFTNNPVMQYAILGGLGLLLIGAGISALISFILRQNDALYKTLRDQITDLRNEVAQVENRERECNALRLQDRSEFKELLKELREAGSLPDRRVPR